MGNDDAGIGLLADGGNRDCIARRRSTTNRFELEAAFGAAFSLSLPCTMSAWAPNGHAAAVASCCSGQTGSRVLGLSGPFLTQAV